MTERDTFSRLQHILASQFGRSETLLTREATLKGVLMLDSLDLVDLVFLIGCEFGVEASVERCAEARSLGGLADLIDDRLQVGLPV